MKEEKEREKEGKGLEAWSWKKCRQVCNGHRERTELGELLNEPRWAEKAYIHRGPLNT